MNLGLDLGTTNTAPPPKARNPALHSINRKKQTANLPGIRGSRTLNLYEAFPFEAMHRTPFAAVIPVSIVCADPNPRLDPAASLIQFTPTALLPSAGHTSD